MADDVVFFSRCKPRKLNLQQLALDFKCILFGWPLLRKDTPYKREEPSSYLVAPDAPEGEWRLQLRAVEKPSREYMKNRNLVRERVGPASIALIPCHDRGLIYAGHLAGPYRTRHIEEMYQRALPIFAADGVVESDHERLASELVQGWDVKQWVPLPTPTVPAWIRASLFGQSTYGIVGSQNGSEKPRDVIAGLIECQQSGKDLGIIYLTNQDGGPRTVGIKPESSDVRPFQALLPR